jgi:hypothetical protein
MTKIALPKKHKASLSSRVEVRNKSSGNVLSVNEEVKPLKPVRAANVMMVRDVVSVKLSLGYNSCGIEVGVEMPFPCEPGDLQAAAKNMNRVSAMIEKKLEQKVQELKATLETLSGG